MILYCKDSLGCIDNNNIELINNMVLSDDILLHLILYISEAKKTDEQRNKQN